MRGFQRHVNREVIEENIDAEKTKDNIILIGNENVEEYVFNYLEGVKLRDNSVIARELVLSAGNGFWGRLSDMDRKKWIDTNTKFLEYNFGSNCVYSVLHLDETTPHIHTLIVPKFWNEKKGFYELNNSYYFDGKSKMIAWQDKYTATMTDNFNNVFMRGIRGSKSKHIDLKTYYSLINENLDEKQAESIVSYAKENYLNRKKVQELQETLQNNQEIMKACEKIIKTNKELKESKKLYEHTIETLAAKYKIPKKEVMKILDSKKAKDIKNKKERER
ncbi:plasmid recombination protein [Clostridium gasigenes]|uniref:plasmid recombination protein n=1 Tax=Clostridium gasigenes TaxID=94869 RepID=UPI001C0E63F9|nr:plasmid recombination protein [Clostridium gasigenes]MBU3107121.1 plasmid recombination protein [Clostridium gasigenes]